MPLNIRRHQQKPPIAHIIEDEHLNKILDDQYEKMLSKRGVDDRVEIITDPITADLTTAEADIDAAQTDIATNATAVALKLQTHSYTELVQAITPAADAAWTEIDLSGYGVLAGDICDIEFRHIDDSTNDNDVGCRTLGSGVARLSVLKATQGASIKSYPLTTMRVLAGTGGVIEVYEQDDSAATTTLFGYERFSTS